MAATQASTDEAKDEALAKILLKGLEIGIESNQAATDRANAALITLMNRTPDIEVLAPWQGTDDCFRQVCDEARDAESWQHDFKTDEQLSADGCFTRAQSLELACGVRSNNIAKSMRPPQKTAVSTTGVSMPSNPGRPKTYLITTVGK